jgi:hypothetical protein
MTLYQSDNLPVFGVGLAFLLGFFEDIARDLQWLGFSGGSSSFRRSTEFAQPGGAIVATSFRFTR